MRIITGQEFVSSGTVRVDGQNPLENDAVLGRMMFVKESQVYPDIKVKRALEAASWFYPGWDAELADQLMKDFDLPANRALKKLSRGMHSAVGIVIGLAARAEITLFDEPYLSKHQPEPRPPHRPRSNGVVRRNRTPTPRWAWLRANRGSFDVEREATGMEIVADSRAAWTGWIELATEPVDEINTRMTSQVILDIAADVLGVVEARDALFGSVQPGPAGRTLWPRDANRRQRQSRHRCRRYDHQRSRGRIDAQ